MPTYLEATVLVPADRVREFQIAVGTLVAGRMMPPATPGSSGDSWQEVTVPIEECFLPGFFASFATWLDRATSPDPKPPLPDLDLVRLQLIWADLPESERELLRLLSDDYGRPVGWVELKRKLVLVGKPNLSRDFPCLTEACVDPPAARFPVRQDGKDDDAVFSLPSQLVGPVRTL